MLCIYRFSAGASKQQTAFIRHQPQRVKELICRMKAWRNVMWEGSKESRPKSFLISLLVITAYNRVGAEYNMKFKRLASRYMYGLHVGDSECNLTIHLHSSRTTKEVQKLVKQASEDRRLE